MLKMTRMISCLLLAAVAMACANQAENLDSSDTYAQATLELEELVTSGQLDAEVTASDLVAEGRVELLHVLDHGALSVEVEWENPTRLQSLLEQGPLALRIDFARVDRFLARPELNTDVQAIERETVAHALRDGELATICGARKLMATATVDVGEGPESVVLGFEYLPRDRFETQQGALSAKAAPTKSHSGSTFVASDRAVMIDWPIGVKGCPLSKNHPKCNNKNDCQAWIGPFEFEGHCGPSWIICDCWI